MKIKDLPISIRIFYIINTEQYHIKIEKKYPKLIKNRYHNSPDDILNGEVSISDFEWAYNIIDNNGIFWQRIYHKYGQNYTSNIF